MKKYVNVSVKMTCVAEQWVDMIVEKKHVVN